MKVPFAVKDSRRVGWRPVRDGQASQWRPGCELKNDDVLGANVLWAEHGDVYCVAGVGVGVVELVDKGKAVERYLVEPVVYNTDAL